NFKSLTWKQKIRILRSISDNLDYIHQKYIHRDLHSKNILMFSTEDFIPHAFDLNGNLVMIQAKVGGKLETIEPKISDLGLSSEAKNHDIQKYG
ncbi:556_t:CDS:1, partial [Racocetra fulgida]